MISSLHSNHVTVRYSWEWTITSTNSNWKNTILLGRLGEAEEVAGVVAFLVSDDASFITAETIQIGGGQALGI